MKRREFLSKSAQALTAATLAGEAILFSNGCQSGEVRKAVLSKPNFEVVADSRFPQVVLAYNTNHSIALRSALDAIGGIGRFINPGEKVLLKPNVAFDRVPEQAVNTNPVVVGEMVRQCKIAGASEILVTDNGSSNPQRTFSRSGITDAVEKNGGTILYLDESDFLKDNLNGKFITEWPVLKYIYEVDRLINMPIAKHHGLVYGTASMKNFFGAIGGNRGLLHERLDQAIVDLAAFFKPTLTVVDATRVLMQDGPTGGSFSNVKTCDSIICTTDQVAGDSRACEFLGRSAHEINHVVLAAEQGLGKIDYREAGYIELL